MNKLNISSPLKILVFISVTILITHCAGTPDTNPMMNDVQSAYDEIESDSLIINNAALELRNAKEAVSRARWLVNSGGNEAAIEKQLDIAKQRLEIARKAADLQMARNEVQRTSNELQALLQNRNPSQSAEMDNTERYLEEPTRRLTNFETEQTSRGLIIRFQSGIFELSKTYLKSSAAGAINELADYLNEFPDRSVLVEGHTDSTGSRNINQKISQQRADAVREALVARDVAADRIQAVGLGEQYPRVSNRTEAGRAYNRRVEVVLSDTTGVIPPRDE